MSWSENGTQTPIVSNAAVPPSSTAVLGKSRASHMAVVNGRIYFSKFGLLLLILTKRPKNADLRRRSFIASLYGGCVCSVVEYIFGMVT